ncbi:hypothetical protein DF185_09370 [Marinifilum breve]|uniref:Uncharacterized protein n=1 Tax=Marinifilum breve TaxID=2184082 RepID=A0A2V4A1D6_9BACT|nr:hypothetical protein [Marinifilum breve]PXY01667.1 hypothetical protein DF185_09370 [Marinifilum breve]
MKKTFLLLISFVAVFGAVNAQNKITKKLEMSDWVNEAVVDANDVAGGVHTYANWTDLNAENKYKKFRGGMIISVAGDLYKLAGTATNVTAANKDAIAGGQWTYIGPMKTVASTAARLALVPGSGDTDTPMLAAGTVVRVETADGATNYVFNGTSTGKYDAGDTTDELKEVYWSNLSSPEVEGYIYTSGALAAKASSISDLTKGEKNTKIPATEITLTDEKFVAVAFPKAWGTPSIKIAIGTKMYNLDDCWTVSHETHEGVEYVIWASDVKIKKEVASDEYKILVNKVLVF